MNRRAWVIQRHLRAYLMAKKVREAKILFKTCEKACLLQRAMRGFIVRKQLIRVAEETEAAVVRI